MEWFLIYKNEHLGPYSKDYLLSLFKDGDIDKNSIVWKEGWDEAQSFEEAFLLNESEKIFQPLDSQVESFHINSSNKIIKDDEVPPDLPPDLPIDALDSDDLDEDEEEVRVEYFEQEVDEPKSLDDFEELDDLEDEKFAQDEQEIEELVFEDEIADSKMKFAYLFIALLLIAIPAYYYYSSQRHIFTRPADMSVRIYDQLKQVAMIESNKIEFSYALSEDKSRVWIATSHPLSGEVLINLRSVPAMSLGDPVEIKAKGYLKDHLIEISEYNFLQGSKLIDGYYNIEIYTLEKLNTPLIPNFSHNWDLEFRFLEENLISSLSRKEFNKIIEAKNSKLERNEKQFFNELIEQYRTVKTITTEIRDSINKVFEVPTDLREQALRDFENKYKSRYGVFFTSFVISVDEKYQVVINQEFENKLDIIAHYNKLRELAEKIGAESVARLEDLKSANLNQVDSMEFNNIKFKSLMNFNEIILECSKQLEKLPK